VVFFFLGVFFCSSLFSPAPVFCLWGGVRGGGGGALLASRDY